MDYKLSAHMVVDLLRSGWIVERSRAALYEAWATEKSRLSAGAEMALERAEIVAASLQARGRGTDDSLVEQHTRWMANLAGRRPGEEPFGELFLVRLGDWVEGHVRDYLNSGVGRLSELGVAERSGVTFPSSLPPPPPFEPVEAIEVAPPGPARFRFGILADLHFGSAHGEATARAAIKDLNDSGAELVIQLGDITDHGNRDEFELATATLAELDMPFATMMGNHDVFSYQEERLAGRELYAGTFGREPDGVLLEHKGVRFAVLDSVEHDASPFAPFNLLTGEFMEGIGGAVVRGSLTPAQHDILAEIAAPGSGPAFVFLHHPVQPFTGFPPVIFGLRDQDSGRLHAVCDSGNVWGVFAGHTHRNARTRDYGSVPAQEVAIPRDYPCGYALVDVSDEGYAYRFVQISDEGLLRRGYDRAGTIHRRYGLGSERERAFTWRRPVDESPVPPARQ